LSDGASCIMVRIAVPVGCLTGAAVVTMALLWIRYVRGAAMGAPSVAAGQGWLPGPRPARGSGDGDLESAGDRVAAVQGEPGERRLGEDAAPADGRRAGRVAAGHLV